MIILDRKRVARWVRDKIGQGGWGEWYQAVGHEKDGELIAGVVYNFLTESDVVVHIAARGPWLTREYAHAIFAYPFEQLGVRRLSAFPRASDERTQKLLGALGFNLEGRMRHMYPDDDAVVFGLLREECRYIISRAA